MAQINPCLHDDVDLVHFGRWLVINNVDTNLVYYLFVNQAIITACLHHHCIAIEHCNI